MSAKLVQLEANVFADGVDPGSVREGPKSSDVSCRKREWQRTDGDYMVSRASFSSIFLEKIAGCLIDRNVAIENINI